MAAASAVYSSLPDPAAQRAIVESMLNKRLVEGEFWVTILSEWFHLWKKYVGLGLSQRKSDHSSRGLPPPPGNVYTMSKSAPRNSELIHEEAWRILVGWYGLAEGQKVIKHVVYSYGDRLEIERNFNTFCFYLHVSDPQSAPQFDITPVLRCSKLEKVGHLEWRARQLFQIPANRVTRLWGKTIETDPLWKPLLRRDRPIGKVLELDSDFLRSSLALDVCEPDGSWCHRPSEVLKLPQEFPDHAMGRLCEQSIFENPTSGWEADVHDQIDQMGRVFMRQLHQSFSGFVIRAKDYVEENQVVQRIQEQKMLQREEHLREQERLLDVRELELNTRIEDHSEMVKVHLGL